MHDGAYERYASDDDGGGEGPIGEDATGPVEKEMGGLHFSNNNSYAKFMSANHARVFQRGEQAASLVNAAEQTVRAQRADMMLASRLRRQVDDARANPDMDPDRLVDLETELDAVLGRLPAMEPSLPAGIRATKQVLQDSVTDGDVDSSLRNDEHMLRWTGCMFPEFLNIQTALGGPPQTRATCWGCLVGGAKVSESILREIEDTWNDLYGYIDDATLASQIELYYEEMVRKPNNEKYTDQQRRREQQQQYQHQPNQSPAGGIGADEELVEHPLGPWAASTIVEHFEKHALTASVARRLTIKDLYTMSTFIKDKEILNENVFDPQLQRTKDAKIRTYMQMRKFMLSELDKEETQRNNAINNAGGTGGAAGRNGGGPTNRAFNPRKARAMDAPAAARDALADVYFRRRNGN